MPMRTSGRVSLLLVAGIVSFVFVLALLFVPRESVTGVGNRFMTALAQGDVDTLTEMSYIGNAPPETVREEWRFATQEAGRHYRFIWRVTGATQASDNSASVRMQVVRDSVGYEENYQLPLVKTEEGWKVDVRGISRSLYPALPRGAEIGPRTASAE
jgi:hypothetical protein